MKVEAKRKGFYNNLLRKPGCIFHIDSEKQFSKAWMLKVEGKKSNKDEKPKQSKAIKFEKEVI